MKKEIIIILVIAALIGVIFFSGIIPGLDILDGSGTTTTRSEVGGIAGRGGYELIGPLNRKGFIISYKADGFSESITLTGSVDIGALALGRMNSISYLVYGKKNAASTWEILSQPGTTSKYISNPNPGEVVAQWDSGRVTICPSYSFSIVGNTYHAIKAIFRGFIDPNTLNPFDGNFKQCNLLIDEAYLYEGWGGLYLPKDADGRPRSTFEIGETVNIGVKTTYGGYTVGVGGNTWRVAMIRPADQGGAEYKHQDYGDNANSYFTFTVTADMVKLDGTSNNRYTIEIYNTLVPQGTLFVNTIDFLAKAPSDVTFSGNIQYKVGDTVSIKLSATRNKQTQLAIKYFEVSVFYGPHDVLLPSDPTSPEWIINTMDVPAVSSDGTTYTATVSFIPTKESFVTIHGKAYDPNGRASLHTKYFTMWIYHGYPVPDDTIDDNTGQGDYAGGHTNPWIPWEPVGNWGDRSTYDEYVYLIVAIAVLAIFIMLAGFLPFGKVKRFAFFKNYGIIVRIVIVIIGVVLAVLIYLGIIPIPYL